MTDIQRMTSLSGNGTGDRRLRVSNETFDGKVEVDDVLGNDDRSCAVDDGTIDEGDGDTNLDSDDIGTAATSVLEASLCKKLTRC